jgi:hypothetical protein
LRALRKIEAVVALTRLKWKNIPSTMSRQFFYIQFKFTPALRLLAGFVPMPVSGTKKAQVKKARQVIPVKPN